MSSKFNSSRRPQQTPKVCKKGMIPFTPGHEFWPLRDLSVFTAWRTTDPNYPFIVINRFTIPETIYPQVWEGFSAPNATRFFVRIALYLPPNIFDLGLTIYHNGIPLQQVLWNQLLIDVDQPFNSRLLERGPPEVDGIAALMITE